MINPADFEMYDSEGNIIKENKNYESEKTIIERFKDIFPNKKEYKLHKNDFSPKKSHKFSGEVDKKVYDFSDKFADLFLPDAVHPSFKEAIKVGMAYVLEDYLKKNK